MPEAEPGLRGLRLGILVFRWSSLVLMVALVLAVDTDDPLLTWSMLGALTGWNLAVTLTGSWSRPWARWGDLVVSVAVLLVAPLIAAPGTLTTQPFFAAAYPLSTIVTWAAESGVGQSLAVAGVLFVPLTLSRPLNGLPYEDLPSGEVISVVSGGLYYAMGSLTVGLFSRALDRAAQDLRRAMEEASQLREQAARLHEREGLAREIHDSVLQSMALVHRRGQDLARSPLVPGPEVAELVGIVAAEERSLRTMLSRVPEVHPNGTVPLRTLLEASAYGVSAVPITITTADPIWVAASCADGIRSAVRQALENAANHASASAVTVFGEREGDDVVVSVRDDGVGFEFDEHALRAAGRLGILHGMMSRIEELGGHVGVTSAPGKGTYIEFRLPAYSEVPGA